MEYKQGAARLDELKEIETDESEKWQKYEKFWGASNGDEVDKVGNFVRKEVVVQKEERRAEIQERTKRPRGHSDVSPSPKRPNHGGPTPSTRDYGPRPLPPVSDTVRATKGPNGQPLRGWAGDIDFTTKATALQDLNGIGKKTHLPLFIEKTR